MSALGTIKKEAEEIEQESAIAAKAHFIDSRRWHKRNLYIGMPATILAAIAGVTAFGELPKEITGGVAMVVAALTAIGTFLSPADRATSHRTSSATFTEIRRNANLLKDVHAELADEGDKEGLNTLVKALEDLNSKMSQYEQGAQSLSTTALGRARAELAS